MASLKCNLLINIFLDFLLGIWVGGYQTFACVGNDDLILGIAYGVNIIPININIHKHFIVRYIFLKFRKILLYKIAHCGFRHYILHVMVQYLLSIPILIREARTCQKFHM